MTKEVVKEIVGPTALNSLILSVIITGVSWVLKYFLGKKYTSFHIDTFAPFLGLWVLLLIGISLINFYANWDKI